MLYQNRLICVKEHSLMKQHQVQSGSEYCNRITFVPDGVCLV